MIGDRRRTPNASCNARRPRATGTRRRYGIIFVCPASLAMEAEQLNQLENTIADLRERASGLRRYL